MIKRGREAIKESLSKTGSDKDRPETNWINWKNGETKTIRFLTDIDDTLVVSVHSMVDTFHGKKSNFVCRSVFDESCELCAAGVYKKDSGYGIAVVRQPVYEDSEIVGYEDQVVEVDEETPSGVVRKRKPVVGIVNQSMRNFWNTIALINEKYGSLKDFDLEIHRQGAKTDTTYVAFPLPPKPIENIDERYKKFLPDLEGFLTTIGSEGYYNYHLHGIEAEKKDSDGNVVQKTSEPAKSPKQEEVLISAVSDDFEELTIAERLKSKMADDPYS